MNPSPVTRLSCALGILGAAALFVGAGALLLQTAREVGLSTLSAEAGSASEPSTRSSAKWRCAQCGRIAARRELRADASAERALQVEYTVRMADGSTRTFEEPAAVSWRLGEPLMIIE
ncbi:MAG TPA: hypothetical protein VI321_08445 [Burkholderiales bacterium]